jgi:hypothetical protein
MPSISAACIPRELMQAHSDIVERCARVDPLGRGRIQHGKANEFGKVKGSECNVVPAEPKANGGEIAAQMEEQNKSKDAHE